MTDSLIPKPIRRLRQALHRVAAAEVANSWKGSQHPDTHEGLERQLKSAYDYYHKVEQEIYRALPEPGAPPSGDYQRLLELSEVFLDEVLPQAGRLVFQDYAALNEFSRLISKLKREQGND